MVVRPISLDAVREALRGSDDYAHCPYRSPFEQGGPHRGPRFPQKQTSVVDYAPNTSLSRDASGSTRTSPPTTSPTPTSRRPGRSSGSKASPRVPAATAAWGGNPVGHRLAGLVQGVRAPDHQTATAEPRAVCVYRIPDRRAQRAPRSDVRASSRSWVPAAPAARRVWTCTE